MKEVRQAGLLRLLDEDAGPERGRKKRLATRIGKQPAQVSQWLSGYRSIEEDTARDIERRAGKPGRWMDTTHDASADPRVQPETIPAAPPDLSHALPVLLDALTGLTPYEWGQVRSALDQLMTNHELRADMQADVLQRLQTGAAYPAGTHAKPTGGLRFNRRSPPPPQAQNGATEAAWNPKTSPERRLTSRPAGAGDTPH